MAVAVVHTVAFQGMQAQPIEVQAQVSPGLPAFVVVGLPDKAVNEARERVRGALHAMALSLPPKRITINLAPADVAKEGSHFDLPIALALLIAIGILPQDAVNNFLAMGELSLDGRIQPVAGVLPATMHALNNDKGMICPKACGAEAAWVAAADVLAAPHLLSIINHFKGTQVLAQPQPPTPMPMPKNMPDFADVKGQETAKRALEIVAAGGHHVLMLGPPGAGKSMLAARLPSILPPLSAQEALEISMVHSLSGLLQDGHILRQRPFRDPHHSASQPALVGGGQKAKPGEISLAHHGVLFLDELPEFARPTLEALRQPIESGEAVIARANHHVTYPARFQLVAAMNPCRCGHVADAAQACARAPKCASDYQNRLSGPLLDRFDVFLEMPAVSVKDLQRLHGGEPSATIAARVLAARAVQAARNPKGTNGEALNNAQLSGQALTDFATPDAAGQNLLLQAAEKMQLSARGYARVLRVARTIADLDHAPHVLHKHVAEALSYRRRLAG